MLAYLPSRMRIRNCQTVQGHSKAKRGVFFDFVKLKRSRGLLLPTSPFSGLLVKRNFHSLLFD
jgi:hypothetical protein